MRKRGASQLHDHGCQHGLYVEEPRRGRFLESAGETASSRQARRDAAVSLFMSLDYSCLPSPGPVSFGLIIGLFVATSSRPLLHRLQDRHGFDHPLTVVAACLRVSNRARGSLIKL
ncbi:uncharacterized protein BDV14DRAFT_15550 [Aspergillus stella-maris]|uniref:uncharacterized protein n=1 Tax=Aspergillus stella-maris TaxID=1810926 RepID=UPI003CCDFDA9